MPADSSSKVSGAATGVRPGFRNIPKNCVVTGGSGVVGQRLVEMLIERGAERVVSFDIAPKPKVALDDPRVAYVQGDLTKPEAVLSACSGADCVFHIAALVGPYHAPEAFMKVNYEGTLNVLSACKTHGIKRLVMSSSPSTRFPYPDPNVNGYTEEQLFKLNGGDYAPKFMQPYAETKAMGEKAVREACGTKNSDLLTIAVAPHQVYGPRDALFLPSLLDAAASGSLRIFGDGENLISFCHVDNYCHGLILGYEALYEGSPALGKYYVVTDGKPVKIWHVLDECFVALGIASLFSKFKIPTWLIMGLAYLAVWLGNLFATVTGTPKHVVNHRIKLNPFAVKMMFINRYFDISGAKRDLQYEPLIEFNQGWKQTIEWFKLNWKNKYN
jgi:nucleoside-diphosphate-sugar epimerase